MERKESIGNIVAHLRLVFIKIEYLVWRCKPNVYELPLHVSFAIKKSINKGLLQLFIESVWTYNNRFVSRISG